MVCGQVLFSSLVFPRFTLPLSPSQTRVGEEWQVAHTAMQAPVTRLWRPGCFLGFHHGSSLLWGQHFLRRFFCEACTHCSNLNNLGQACGVHTLMGTLGVRHSWVHRREAHTRQSHASAVKGLLSQCGCESLKFPFLSTASSS